MIRTIQYNEGVTRGGGHHGRGPVLVSRRKGHGAAERQDPNESGQALVTLLIFIVMATAIALAASFIIASNSIAATNIQEGIIARQMADSGAETAYLKLIRSAGAYTGETITVGGGSVVITVTGTTTKTIDSVATNGNFIKKVESVATYSNNVLTQVSWKEIN